MDGRCRKHQCIHIQGDECFAVLSLLEIYRIPIQGWSIHFHLYVNRFRGIDLTNIDNSFLFSKKNLRHACGVLPRLSLFAIAKLGKKVDVSSIHSVHFKKLSTSSDKLLFCQSCPGDCVYLCADSWIIYYGKAKHNDGQRPERKDAQEGWCWLHLHYGYCTAEECRRTQGRCQKLDASKKYARIPRIMGTIEQSFV